MVEELEKTDGNKIAFNFTSANNMFIAFSKYSESPVFIIVEVKGIFKFLKNTQSTVKKIKVTVILLYILCFPQVDIMNYSIVSIFYI